MLRLNQGIKLGVLALLTSVSTLLCCALPLLLVTLGLGSVVATATLQLPFLVTLSEHKLLMFALSAALLALSAWAVWRKQACPADPVLAKRCQQANRLGKRLVWIAGAIWVFGLVSSYLLLPLQHWLNL